MASREAEQWFQRYYENLQEDESLLWLCVRAAKIFFADDDDVMNKFYEQELTNAAAAQKFLLFEWHKARGLLRPAPPAVDMFADDDGDALLEGGRKARSPRADARKRRRTTSVASTKKSASKRSTRSRKARTTKRG